MTEPDHNATISRTILERLIAMQKRLQWTIPGYAGGLTIRVLTGGGSANDAAPTNGQNVYGSKYDTCIDPAGNADFLTDINVWSRGSVSTAGAVTPNTTSILVGQPGGPYIPLAPGETYTFRKKSPSNIYIRAGAQTAAADTVVAQW